MSKHTLDTEPAAVSIRLSFTVPERWGSDDEIREAAAKADQREREAWFLGPFAVHESQDSGRWTVTHARTGFSLRSNFPSRRSALGAAAEALISVPESWDFDDPCTPRTWSAESREAVRRACFKGAQP